MAFVALVLAVLLAGVSDASAQAVSGTLLGTITDSEALPIPGASVTITEVNTNIKIERGHATRTATSCSRASGTASTASKRS